MGLCEDHECSVCLLPFTRRERIPRVLHCRHTFCDQCLETMSKNRGSLLTVGCPLCRRITCVGPDRSLKEALWVNATLWEKIADDIQEEEEVKEEERIQAEQAKGASSPSRTKLRLPALFKKLRFSKQHQEKIIPGSNVEIKSWRRLS